MQFKFLAETSFNMTDSLLSGPTRGESLEGESWPSAVPTDTKRLPQCTHTHTQPVWVFFKQHKPSLCIEFCFFGEWKWSSVPEDKQVGLLTNAPGMVC